MTHVRTLDTLTPRLSGQVRALADEVASADGVAALSEQFLLDLHAGSDAAHVLVEADGRLVGYAQLAHAGMPASAAELLVAPSARRRGVGRALVAALPRDARIWSHGDLPAARAFAAALGLHTVRELHRMRLSFTAAGLERPQLPPGLAVRTFRPGEDDEAWVQTNAAAFATHPEQGRLTLADLHERMAQPWFDPAGFLLVVPDADPHRDPHRESHRDPPRDPHRDPHRDPPRDPHPDPHREWSVDVEKGPEFQHLLTTRGGGGPATRGAGEPATREAGGPAIAAFHWTKAPPAEVYVIGVHPAYQGHGLGRAVTLLGLHHLRDLGYREVTLYSDGDNAPALTIYRSLGFVTIYVDRMVAFPADSEDATMGT